jgi:UDP-N-acetyl-2-amino-2-deoxyglucuronate dehydrogenase
MRFAFAGLGTATRSLHLPALTRVDEVSAVAGCDPSGERRQRFERETGLPAYETLDELLERSPPDLVVVATPPGSHAELCVRALEHGAHVLCEKPLATSVADADRILAAAERNRRAVAVHHGFREQPIFRALRDRIGSPEIGPLLFCQVWQLMDLPPWKETAPWRAAAPDQTLLEGGVHLVDLMLVLFGTAPEAVYARQSAGTHADRRADAISLLTLEFPDGRLGHLLIDRLCRGGDRYAEVRADCEHASLRASWGGRALAQVGKKRARTAGVHFELSAGGIAWVERGPRRRTLARDPRRPELAGTAALLGRIVAALEAGRDPPSSGREARATLEVIEAAYRSARSGERVPLPSTATRRVREQPA